MGLALRRVPDYPRALSVLQRSLRMYEGLGDDAAVAKVLIDMGNTHMSRGEYGDALAALRRALPIRETLGDKAGVARIFNNIGIVHEKRGEYPEALSVYHQSLEMARAIGDRKGIAFTLGNIGNVHACMGENPEALSYHRRALEEAEALDDMPFVARETMNIGVAHEKLGQYPAALSAYHRALEIAEGIRYKPTIARAHMNIGNVHHLLGELSEALAAHRRALEVAEAIGHKPLIAKTLNNIGMVYANRREYGEALATYKRSIEIKEALGDQRGIVNTLVSIANAQTESGAYPEALATYRRALERTRALGNRVLIAGILGNIAFVHHRMDDNPQAIRMFRQSLEELEAVPGPDTRARALWGLALVAREQKEWEPCLRYAREAVGVIGRLGRGLAEQQGATAGDLWSAVFEVGTTVAARANRGEDLAFFLESGRASMLREALVAREALRSVLLPEALGRAETAARDREARAMEALRKAAQGGSLEEIRGAKGELERSQRNLEEVVARIQRTAKAGASIAYPEVDGISDMQPRLAAGDALVLYGLTDAEGVALVVRRKSARVVTLAPSEELVNAAAALEAGDPGRSPDPEPLRRLLVEPLELNESVQRVLVSPAGRLGYLPFALLFEGKEVSYLPSGTSHGLLLEEREKRGESVLAVGDPDYGTAVREETVTIMRRAADQLVPLPGTRHEVEAIGSVRLLGADATENGVADALAKRERWRAVHFACHGLVDPDRPMISSLALTATNESDGFLTCLDVFRMRIPADLVVLSACETGKGRIYKVEGIVGLTRAFMYAGSPRVICSLWKVDDEATRALMEKFYELWNPKDGSEGLPAATALKNAMAHVRDHPDHDWKHPYYWAAWQLWGLPD